MGLNKLFNTYSLKLLEGESLKLQSYALSEKNSEKAKRELTVLHLALRDFWNYKYASLLQI